MSSSLFIHYLVIQSYIMRPVDSAVKQTINIVNTGSYQPVYTLYQITVIHCSCITCLYYITASQQSFITSVPVLDHCLSQKPVFRLTFELWPSQIQSKSTNHLVVTFVLVKEGLVHIIYVVSFLFCMCVKTTVKMCIYVACIHIFISLRSPGISI